MSKVVDKLDLLKTEIQKSIDSTNRDKLRYRGNAFRIYILSTILTISITVISGLDTESIDSCFCIQDAKFLTKTLILLISATVIVLNAFEFFFQNRSLWVSNNEANNKLRKIKFDIEFEEKESENITILMVSDWKNEYQKIIDSRNENWEKQRSKLNKNET